MAQVLLDLIELMSEAAQKIDTTCKQKNVAFPTLDGPLDNTSEAIRRDAEVAASIDILAAAAQQIIATARAPTRTIFDSVYAFHTSSALRTAAAVNVAEVLRKSGPKGAHVDDIVEGTVVAPSKLARVLRLLASQHIFTEVAPDVFANNRVSSVLDTGKDVAELRAYPEKRYDNTNGLPALIEHGLDTFYKAGPYMTETLTDPATAASDSPNEAPFSVALRTEDDFWTWLDRPENAPKLHRFGVAMQGAKSLVPEGYIAQGFDWNDLPKDATVVDVGGGTGHVSMVLAKEFPHLKLVVQDRPMTIQHGIQYWQENMPEALPSGRAELQGHDFFQPQPPRNPPPALYMLRFIVHDWADSYAARIMRVLRDAAAPTTRLMIIERLVPYACDVDEGALGIPGAESTLVVPEPLLPNLGIVSLNCYFGDFQMLNAVNGQERTLLQFKNLFEMGGWKLDRVYRMPGFTAQLIGSPA